MQAAAVAPARVEGAVGGEGRPRRSSLPIAVSQDCFEPQRFVWFAIPVVFCSCWVQTQVKEELVVTESEKEEESPGKEWHAEFDADTELGGSDRPVDDEAEAAVSESMSQMVCVVCFLQLLG